MITGNFSVTTVDEIKALAKLGVTGELTAYARHFFTVKRYSNNIVTGGRLAPLHCRGFRVCKGVVQFDATVDGRQEWVTPYGTWEVTFERKNPAPWNVD